MFLRTDIALKSDIDRAFLPMMTAALVFVAALISWAALEGERLAAGWDRRLTGSIMVEVLPNVRAKDPQRELDERLALVRRALANTPGVKSHGVISLDETKSMLRPWLGEVDATRLGIPLPRVVSVELSGVVRLDEELLAAKMKGLSSLVNIESSDSFAGSFKGALRASRVLLGGIVLLILGALSAVLSYATKASIGVNRRAIGIMRMVGAENGYIESRLSNKMTRMALSGGAAGYALAVCAIAAMSAYVRGIWPEFSPHPSGFALLAAIPAIAAVMAKALSGAVVRIYLKRSL